MAIEIVINVGRAETRVAVLDNKVVTGLFIERKKERGIVGNVYKGRVTKVLPGMQAAFVDIGVEKAAFLHVSEATASIEDVPQWMEEENGQEHAMPASREAQRHESESREAQRHDLAGDEPVGEVVPEHHEDPERVTGAEHHAGAAGPDDHAGTTLGLAGPGSDPSPAEPPLLSGPAAPGPAASAASARGGARRGPRPLIEHLLQEGQEIMVQASKDPIGTKGPRVTTYASLPGRHLVMTPTVNHVGVSRQIQRPDERARLRDLVMRFRKPGIGYIVRTVSEGTTEEEVRADTNFLGLLWQKILEQRERLAAPALLHTDLDVIFRTIRDLFTDKVSRLVIDSREEHQRVLEFMNAYLPHLTGRLELYDKDEPVFDAFGIEVEIARALGRKVWLKSGGYIVIEHTEALTVIDVNTGRYVGKRDVEDTIFKTNLDAVKEIAYQLRLRNIGGIIIIDFIDMEREKNRETVFAALQEAMRTDRARHNLSRISELGLVQMSRERTRENLKSVLCEPCAYCDGRGHTKSPTTICYEIFREIQRLGPSPQDKKIIVGVHPAVADLLYDEERQGIEDLERMYHKRVIVKADPSLHREEYEIATL